MQFCPRCGSRNQDERAACWKCFGQLQKSDSKKAQHILLTDKDAPAAAVHATPEPAVEEAPAVVAPIPELAEPEPAPEPPVLDFSVAPPVSEPEPAPQVASFGDIIVPSPSFDTADQGTEDEDDAPQAVPILGLVNLPEDEQEPDTQTLDLGSAESVPVFGIEGLSDEPLAAATGTDAADETGDASVPWWLAQDEAEDDSTDAPAGSTLDLDDGGLQFISLDDTDAVGPSEDEDPDSQKSPPDA